MEKVKVLNGKGWKMMRTGEFNTYTSRRGHGARGKFYMAPFLNTKEVDLSLNSLKPGWINPFLHKHRTQSEVYVFISGTGTMRLGDEEIEVGEGDVVYVEPDVLRAVKNTGSDELRFICIRVEKDSSVAPPEEDGIPVKEKGWFPEPRKRKG